MKIRKIRFGSRRLGRRLNKKQFYNRYLKPDWSNPFGGGGWSNVSIIGRDFYGKPSILRIGMF